MTKPHRGSEYKALHLQSPALGSCFCEAGRGSELFWVW